MRDIIWTLILVWFIYKIVDIFRISSAKRTAVNNNDPGQRNAAHAQAASRPEKDIKGAIKKHLNTEGEYVDFEEVK